MKKWLILLRNMFRASLRPSGKRSNRGCLIALGYLILIPICISYFGYLLSIYNPDSPQSLLVFGLAVAQLFVFFQSVTLVMSAFFFSKDTQLLVPLPFTAGQVLAAKFVAVMAGEYIMQIPFLVPPLLVYGIRAEHTAAYWPIAVLVFLLLPIIPLALGSLLVLVSQRLGLGRRFRDFWSILAGVVSMAFFMGFQFFMSGSRPGPAFARGGPRWIEKLAPIERYVPPVSWPARAIARAGRFSGTFYLLLYLCLCTALVMVLFELGQQVFYTELLSAGEARNEGRRRKTVADAFLLPQRSKRKALLTRESRLFWRTPAWVTGCFASALMLAVVMIVPLLRSGELLAALGRWNVRTACYASLGVAALITLASSLNQIAASALSREGKLVWVSKIIPVSPRAQVRAKMVHAQAVGMLAILPAVAIVLWALRLPFINAAMGLCLGLIGSSIGQAFAIGADLIGPKLDWDEPRQALRKGFLGVVLSFSLMFIMGVGAFIIIILVAAFNLSVMATYGAALIYLGLIAILSQMLVLGSAEDRYNRISA